jgi:hypothetical protein
MNIVLGGRDTMREIMDIFECCSILHNIFLDTNDPIPDEWYQEIDLGHYWTSDTDGSNTMELDEYDRREAVFHSLINDYYM